MEVNRRDFFSALAGAFGAYAAARAIPAKANPIVKGWVDRGDIVLLSGNVDADSSFALEQFGLWFDSAVPRRGIEDFVDNYAVALRVDDKVYLETPAHGVPFDGLRTVLPAILIPAGARVEISCHGTPSTNPVKLWTTMMGAKVYS